VEAVRLRQPTLQSQKGENAGAHTLRRSLTLSLSLSLSRPHQSGEKHSTTIIAPLLATLATYAAPLLRRIMRCTVDPLATPIEHR
jgi:hypothetical protein